MNVLHVVQSFDLSGRSRVIHDLSMGLKASGIESEVACLEGAAGYVQEEIPCWCMGKREGLDPVLPVRLSRLVRRRNVSVLHTHGKAGLVYGAAASLLAGKPVLHTVHRADGDVVPGPGWIRRGLLGRAHTVVAVSDAARQRFAKDNGFPESRTVTIYNGIDVARFARVRPGLDRNLDGQGSGQGSGSDNDRDEDRDDDIECPILGTVANLGKDKDFETLLRAFGGIRAVLPGARLRVAGDGAGRAEIEGLARSEGVDAGVEFLGFTADIPGFLHGLDLFVLSSRTEGLGIAILEAMAAEVPVVASAIGGITEVVKDGETGRLFPGGDHETMTQVAVGLLGDGNERRRLVRNAFSNVSQRFLNERMCEQYWGLYEELAG